MLNAEQIVGKACNYYYAYQLLLFLFRTIFFKKTPNVVSQSHKHTHNEFTKKVRSSSSLMFACTGKKGCVENSDCTQQRNPSLLRLKREEEEEERVITTFAFAFCLVLLQEEMSHGIYFSSPAFSSFLQGNVL